MMLTRTPRSAAALSILSTRYFSFFAGGLLRYSSGDSHPVRLLVLPIFFVRRWILTIEDPYALLGLFQCLGYSPHVATRVNIPFSIITFLLRGKTQKAVVRICVMGAFVARSTHVCMGMNFSNTDSIFDFAADVMHGYSTSESSSSI